MIFLFVSGERFANYLYVGTEVDLEPYVLTIGFFWKPLPHVSLYIWHNDSFSLPWYAFSQSTRHVSGRKHYHKNHKNTSLMGQYTYCIFSIESLRNGLTAAMIKTRQKSSFKCQYPLNWQCKVSWTAPMTTTTRVVAYQQRCTRLNVHNARI